MARYASGRCRMGRAYVSSMVIASAAITWPGARTVVGRRHPPAWFAAVGHDSARGARVSRSPDSLAPHRACQLEPGWKIPGLRRHGMACDDMGSAKGSDGIELGALPEYD